MPIYLIFHKNKYKFIYIYIIFITLVNEFIDPITRVNSLVYRANQPTRSRAGSRQGVAGRPRRRVAWAGGDRQAGWPASVDWWKLPPCSEGIATLLLRP
jgi:hypothetical protein